MTRSPRNPRGAYDAEGREIPPMTPATMREHGVRSVAAERQEIGCGHAGAVQVDHLPADLLVPDVALRRRGSVCGSRSMKTVPDWSQRHGSGFVPGRR